MIFDDYLNIGAEVVTAWRRGGRIKNVVLAAIVLTALALILVGVSSIQLLSEQYAEPVAAALGIVAGLLVLAVVSYERSLRRVATIKKIERAERRAEEHPKEAQAAWELAQIKLESYLDRNLSQVRSVYWLTVFVMLVGFVLIAIGVIRVYADPNALPASVLSAVSGVVVSFIGGSFLLVFKAVLQQAKGYVSTLERINAVGMAVQILDSLDDEDGAVRNKATSDIARELLKMYSQGKTS